MVSYDALRMRARRESETPTQRAKRLKKQREYQRKKRAQANDAELEELRIKNRQAVRAHRCKDTEQESSSEEHAIKS